MKQLLEWLTEAAQQLYGDDPGEHADLVDRTAAVLRNSLLTSAVFSAFEAEDQARRSDVVEGDGASEGAPGMAARVRQTRPASCPTSRSPAQDIGVRAA